MNKNKLKIFLIIIIIIEIILIIVNYFNKYKIAKILNISNINDFFIINMKESIGYDSQRPIYIQFKISIDNYQKYNLMYEDVYSDDNIYEGEITNKKQKISDKYYMCYYETVIYNAKEKINFKITKFNRFYLKLATIVLIILILCYIPKMIKTKNGSQ